MDDIELPTEATVYRRTPIGWDEVMTVNVATNADAYRDGTIGVDLGGWIPVSERLPDTGVRVLVAGRGLCELVLVLAMHYVGGDGERHWYDGPNLVAIGRDVEYWQPLPAPPPDL